MSSFESLSREELRQELVSRHIYDFPPNNKKGMTDILKDHLCGVQRVPALLLLNPTADLWEINLLNYAVLPFEPLHDLKGHIANLLIPFSHARNKASRTRVELGLGCSHDIA